MLIILVLLDIPLIECVLSDIYIRQCFNSSFKICSPIISQLMKVCARITLTVIQIDLTHAFLTFHCIVQARIKVMSNSALFESYPNP